MKNILIFFLIWATLLVSGCGSGGGDASSDLDERKDIPAVLTDLVVSQGELSPVFSKNQTTYSLNATESEITFTPQGNSSLTVSINGAILAINNVSAVFNLSEGSNQYAIKVDNPENLSSNTYVVNVTFDSNAPEPIARGPVPELYEGVEIGGVTDFIDNNGEETTVTQLIEMHLSMDVGSTDFCNGFTSAHLPSTTWGFNINDGREKNNSILGPTLKMVKGKNYRIHVTNNLHDGTTLNPGAGEKSTVHWHGLSLLGEKDGGPHQMINSTYAPDALDHMGHVNPTTWTVDIAMVNDSANFWYHPHAEGITAQHVYNGLAGMIIVKNPDQNPSIPNTYGGDDFPIVIQDKGLGDISLRSNAVSETMADSDDCVLDPDGNVGAIENAYKGAAQVVNGQYKAEFSFPKQLVRLRILNGAGARSYNLGIEDSNGNRVPFYQVGTDGGLLNEPTEITRLLMYNGERNEVLVDLTDAAQGSSYKVRHYGTELDLITLGLGDRNVDITGDQDNLDTKDYDIFKFTASGTDDTRKITVIPSNLRPNNSIIPLNPEDAELYNLTFPRLFTLKNANAIEYDDSGRSEGMQMDVINLSPMYGATEVWRVSGDSGLSLSHPFHVHDGSFQVLKRVIKNADLSEGDEIPLTPAEKGWKDVVQIRQEEYLYIIKEFSFYSYADSPFMLHCHILPHEDDGMMGQWTVIE